MEFAFMDKLLIDIYNIRNIQSIQIRDMLLPVHKSTKSLVVPCLIVTHDGGKMLNLCSKDKYFDTYVKKVVEVYNDEKNNILEDSLTDPFRMRTNIEIDERTKNILESGRLEEISELYRFYDDKESYTNSLLFNTDEVKSLLPILKYHLQRILSNMNMTLNLGDNLTGYRNRFMIDGKLDGIPLEILLLYNKNSDYEYSFQVNGLLDGIPPIDVRINFHDDRIIVKCQIDKYNIISTNTYLISDGVIKSINDVVRNNLSIYYVNEDLEECENELLNLANIDEDTNYKWFKLPWNAYYGIDTKILNLSETEKNIEIASMYLWSDEDSFIKREYFSRSYKRNNTATVNGEIVILDEAVKNTKGIRISRREKIYLIETAFLDRTQTSGYYQEKLENRYFYHIVKSGYGIKNIKRGKMINIGVSDDIIEYGDILSNSSVLKRVRGK